MTDEHKSQEEILGEIKKANSRIAMGAIYVHYKDTDKRYRVKEFATLEATNELCVIYQAEYGDKPL